MEQATTDERTQRYAGALQDHLFAPSGAAYGGESCICGWRRDGWDCETYEVHIAPVVMAVADAEQTELREALTLRPERTTVWQDASDEGYRLQVAHAESKGAAALRRAEAAERALDDERAKVARFHAALNEAKKIGIPTPTWLILSAALAEADQ